MSRYTVGEIRALIARVLDVDLDDISNVALYCTYKDTDGEIKTLYWDSAALSAGSGGKQDDLVVLCNLLAFGRHLAKTIHGCIEES